MVGLVLHKASMDGRSDPFQAFMPSASRRSDVEMYQKGHVKPIFPRTSLSRPMSEASDMSDTEFEEDLSDGEEYSGRRSEESVSY